MLIPHILMPDPAANRLGVLRKKRDREIQRINARYPELSVACEQVATREFSFNEEQNEEDHPLRTLDSLCAEIHLEELKACVR